MRVQIPLANGHVGSLFGVVHFAPGIGGDFGDDLDPLGVEHVVQPEKFLSGLLEGDDGNLFQSQTIGSKALEHVLLDGLGQNLSVFVQLIEGFGCRVTPEGAHHLCFEQVAHLIRSKRFFSQAAAGLQDLVAGMAHVDIEFGHHIHADLVLGEDGLLAGAAYDELDGFQGDPGHLMKDRQHQGAPPQTHLRSHEPGADEGHVGRRPLINPNGNDVENGDGDNGQDDQRDPSLCRHEKKPRTGKILHGG